MDELFRPWLAIACGLPMVHEAMYRQLEFSTSVQSNLNVFYVYK